MVPEAAIDLRAYLQKADQLAPQRSWQPIKSFANREERKLIAGSQALQRQIPTSPYKELRDTAGALGVLVSASLILLFSPVYSTDKGPDQHLPRACQQDRLRHGHTQDWKSGQARFATILSPSLRAMLTFSSYSNSLRLSQS